MLSQGTGSRAWDMYIAPILKDYRDHAEIVGAFDATITRAAYVRDQVGATYPLFTDFDQMLKETKPDVVIVVTLDGSHHEFTIKALEAGCDVICEKPLTVDEEKMKAVLEAEKRTGQEGHRDLQLPVLRL